MTSGKQKRRILDERRATRKRRQVRQSYWTELEWGQASAAQHRVTAVNRAALAPHNSWGYPEFVWRGYYVDQAFECACCGASEIWCAPQQKWWYEVAKGPVYSTAKYCMPAVASGAKGDGGGRMTKRNRDVAGQTGDIDR